MIGYYGAISKAQKGVFEILRIVVHCHEIFSDNKLVCKGSECLISPLR